MRTVSIMALTVAVLACGCGGGDSTPDASRVDGLTGGDGAVEVFTCDDKSTVDLTKLPQCYHFLAELMKCCPLGYKDVVSKAADGFICVDGISDQMCEGFNKSAVGTLCTSWTDRPSCIGYD